MKEHDEIPGKNPFKVPEGYFESLNDRIFSATTGAAKPEKAVNKVFRLRTAMAVAATVVVLIAAAFSVRYLLKSSDKQVVISTASLNPYPQSLLEDIDISMIEEEVAALDKVPAITGINDKDIIEYLVNENISETDIYDRL
ncbi:MAG: hypothetical protein U0X39_03675 [Bacteroidales bacterium]